MNFPQFNELVRYVNKAIKGIDWNTNFQTIVNWLSNGKKDLNVKSITLSSDGGITNNGGLLQNGNLTVAGATSIRGNLNVDGKIFINGQDSETENRNVLAPTLFCVNAGFVNSSGIPQLFTLDSSNRYVQFTHINTSTPAFCVNAQGYREEITHLNDFDAATLDNGTYILFAAKGQNDVTFATNVEVSKKLYIQPNQPSMVNGEIWFDTSKNYITGMKAWKSENNVLKEFFGCPIGKIVVASQRVTSYLTFAYNQNGIKYDIQYILPQGITKYALQHQMTASYGSGGNSGWKGGFKVPYLATFSGGGTNDTHMLEIAVNSSGSNLWIVGQHGNGDIWNSAKVSIVVAPGLYFRSRNDGNDGGSLTYAPLYPDDVFKQIRERSFTEIGMGE